MFLCFFLQGAVGLIKGLSFVSFFVSLQLKDLIVKAMQVKTAYDKYNQSNNGKVWFRENIAEGLVGDVGDLMKLVMAKEGLRHTEKVDEKLAHELSDCLWSIIVLVKVIWT